MSEESIHAQAPWNQVPRTASTGTVFPDDSGRNVTFAEHLARYRFAVQFAKEMRVLDAACGSGYGTTLLAEEGARSVLGVDINDSAISYAKLRYGGRRGVTFVAAPLERLPDLCRDPVDLCVSFETIEHLRDPEQFLRDIRRVLSPGGKLLISSPNRYVFAPTNFDGRHSPNQFHQVEWTTDEFVSLLSHYFSVAAVYGQVFMSAGEAKLVSWRNRLEGRFPKSSQTRMIYAIAGLRRHFPLALPYRGLRRFAFVGARFGTAHSEKGAQPSSSGSGERNQVRAYSSSEAPRYTICLCVKR